MAAADQIVVVRSCHDAVKQSCSNCFNHDFVIDLNIKSFFDTIDHALLMKAVAHFCKDQWVLLYIRRWLTSGIMQENGQHNERFHALLNFAAPLQFRAIFEG